MKIEVKNVKTNTMSHHDSNCFSATLVVDEKEVCEVSDDGNGGCIDYKVSDYMSVIKPIDDWCKENLPKVKIYNDVRFQSDPEFDWNDYSERSMSLSSYIDELIFYQ
jgi:hypothetical protein